MEIRPLLQIFSGVELVLKIELELVSMAMFGYSNLDRVRVSF
jgi:hypothetical protein